MAAPAFSVREADGKPFRFEPKKLSKPTMLIFYRGGWCPYCNAHLKDLRTAVPQVSALGFDVLFLSTDRPEILRSSLKEPVDYHLLSDSEVNAARAFGVAFRMDDATYAKYKSYGLDLEETQGATASRAAGTRGVHRRPQGQDPVRAHQFRLHQAPAGGRRREGRADCAPIVSYRSMSATPHPVGAD